MTLGPEIPKREPGELKTPEIVGWQGEDPRPVYAVPGFLRDPTYDARLDRRDHVIMLLEMRYFTRRLFDFQGRALIRKSITRIEKRPL